jgi:hypothetical protein
LTLDGGDTWLNAADIEKPSLKQRLEQHRLPRPQRDRASDAAKWRAWSLNRPHRLVLDDLGYQAGAGIQFTHL